MAEQITREEFADHMDAFEQRLGARASRSDRRLETIDSRLDAIDNRLDAIDTRLDVIDGRLRLVSDHSSQERRDGAEASPAWPHDLLASESVDQQSGRTRKANGVKADHSGARRGIASKAPKPASAPARAHAADSAAPAIRQRHATDRLPRVKR